jgi:hypothetical protein
MEECPKSLLAGHLTEATVYVAFLLTLLNARGQGRRWYSTLLWGAVVGFGAELTLVNIVKVPRYHYNVDYFWLKSFHVPICIGIGWGIVFYVATWTAQRLKLGSLMSSLVAGVLGVNLDLSLDPVAVKQCFWQWHDDPRIANATLFGVPFDNFVSWVVMIGAYGYCTRMAFRWVNRRSLSDQPAGPPGSAALARSRRGSIWFDFLIPPLGALIAATLFVGVRSYAPKLYGSLSGLQGLLGQQIGEAVVFMVIFAIGSAVFWSTVFRSSRKEQVNWVVLGVVVYFHVLSLMLFLSTGIRELTPLLIMIPTNLIVGVLAYAWPCLDELLDYATRQSEEHVIAPIPIQKTLSSYEGVKQRALVYSPNNERELAAVLAFARNTGRLVTFRAGGQAFDTQSLNDQIVISLERMKRIELNEQDATVTAECGASWKQILLTTLPRGLSPFVMVTTSAATVGGTLSSHSLNRFSATCGREGRHVESLKIILPNGQTKACSRQENQDLFRAVVGGLGYVGAVLQATYRLHRVPNNAVVETEFTRVTGLRSISESVRSGGDHRYKAMVDEFVQKSKDIQPRSDANAG